MSDSLQEGTVPVSQGVELVETWRLLADGRGLPSSMRYPKHAGSSVRIYHYGFHERIR